ncbi:MAG: NACHT domain-containing protein [Desulfomonilaceae bacterium]
MKSDKFHRGGETSFALTTEALQSICPKIELANPALTYYRQALLEETKYLNLKGIPLIDRNVPLETVYIKIQAAAQERLREKSDAERRNLERELENDGKDPSERDSLLHGIRLYGESRYRRGETHMFSLRPDPIDPETALELGHVVLLGSPGSGKSTLLRYLARRSAEDLTKLLPLLVSLRDFAMAFSKNNLISLAEFAVTNAQRLLSSAPPTDIKWVSEALDDEINYGKVLWLLDGLDEAREARDEVAREAFGLSRRGRLIVTSRPVGYNPGPLKALEHFEILPLSPEDVQKFSKDWFTAAAWHQRREEEWAKKKILYFKHELELVPRIGPLTQNPLMLTFLLILSSEDNPKPIPNSRAGLYKLYIEELLRQWETARQYGQGRCSIWELTADQMKSKRIVHSTWKSFYYLSWYLHLAYHGGGSLEPTRDEIKSLIANRIRKEWGNYAEFVADAALAFWCYAGIVDIWELSNQNYLALRHLSFQEYAVAHKLADEWQNSATRTWEFIKLRLHHYAWREPILLLAEELEQRGQHECIIDLVRKILHAGSPYEDCLKRDVRLAANIIGGLGFPPKAVIDEVVTNLLKLAHPTSAYVVRCMA